MVRITEEQRNRLLKMSDLWRSYDQIYSDFAERHGVSTNAMSLIEELAIRPDGIEPAEAADYLGIARQTMTTVLDSLEKKGVIARSPHASDRRRKLVRFTPEGRVYAERLIDKLYEWELSALSAISREEQDCAYGIARRLCDMMKKNLPKPLGADAEAKH